MRLDNAELQQALHDIPFQWYSEHLKPSS
ncbi:hypothetical protein BURKHO8Y_20168 [Burkholderia sp. 8Y]|nr:hypothetical protein BURKHO8Y_20168 [Burkholderia sp. 8Y]